MMLLQKSLVSHLPSTRLTRGCAQCSDMLAVCSVKNAQARLSRNLSYVTDLFQAGEQALLHIEPVYRQAPGRGRTMKGQLPDLCRLYPQLETKHALSQTSRLRGSKLSPNVWPWRPRKRSSEPCFQLTLLSVCVLFGFGASVHEVEVRDREVHQKAATVFRLQPCSSLLDGCPSRTRV